MYYGQRDFNYPTPGNERNIYLKYDLSADSGSAYVIQRAISSEITACPLTPMIPLNPSIGFCDSLPGRFINPQSGCSPFWIGINEIKNEITDLNVFPNPANDNLKIQFYSEKSQIGRFIIYDIYGRKMAESKSKFNKGKNIIVIDVSALRSGMYCVGVNLFSGNYTSKLFIKQSE